MRSTSTLPFVLFSTTRGSFNAGELVEGTDMRVLRDRFVDYIIKVASGELVRNEVNGYREISIFKNGVTL